jgi:hypothetical protein
MARKEIWKHEERITGRKEAWIRKEKLASMGLGNTNRQAGREED